MRRKNQGFALPILIVILLMVGLLSFLGWRLYQVNSKPANTANSESSKSSNNTNSPTKNNAPYLMMEEIGLKMQLTDTIRDLTYSPHILSDGSKTASFSTKSLTDIDSACAAEDGPLGAIEITTNDTYRNGEKKLVDNKYVFKIGENYITYQGPQALCSDKIAGMTNERRDSLAEALKTLEPTE